MVNNKRKATEPDPKKKIGNTAKMPAEDAEKLASMLSKEQLIQVITPFICKKQKIYRKVRDIADEDVEKRNLFVWGIGLETTADAVKAAFENHGEVTGVRIVIDRATGKSRGFCFVTFAHVDSAIDALKKPNKTIQGNMATCKIASENVPNKEMKLNVNQTPPLNNTLQGSFMPPLVNHTPSNPNPQNANPMPPNSNPLNPSHINPNPSYVNPNPLNPKGPLNPAMHGGFHVEEKGTMGTVGKRLYLYKVPEDIRPETLTMYFSQYGEIESGPHGYDKVSGKFKKEYAIIIFKSLDAARKCLQFPLKDIQGHKISVSVAKARNEGNGDGKTQVKEEKDGGGELSQLVGGDGPRGVWSMPPIGNFGGPYGYGVSMPASAGTVQSMLPAGNFGGPYGFSGSSPASGMYGDFLHSSMPGGGYPYPSSGPVPGSTYPSSGPVSGSREGFGGMGPKVPESFARGMFEPALDYLTPHRFRGHGGNCC